MRVFNDLRKNTISHFLSNLGAQSIIVFNHFLKKALFPSRILYRFLNRITSRESKH